MRGNPMGMRGGMDDASMGMGGMNSGMMPMQSGMGGGMRGGMRGDYGMDDDDMEMPMRRGSSFGPPAAYGRRPPPGMDGMDDGYGPPAMMPPRGMSRIN